MKKLLLLLPLCLFAQSPFETPKPQHFDFSNFNTSKKVKKKENMTRIECHFVCEKKFSKEDTINNALSYYKNNLNR